MPSPKTIYLQTFNTTCALLWLRILLTTITLITTSTPPQETYLALEHPARWTQTFAVVEILHAAIGITRAPIFTTFTQVFARTVQVWAVNYAFPEETGSSASYAAMLLAWSAADVIRFSYFVVLGSGVEVPGWLKWLRYSLFTILYPIGIGSEWWLMYGAAKATGSLTGAGVFYFCLGLYAPGAVMMYSYMLKQRRKTLARK